MAKNAILNYASLLFFPDRLNRKQLSEKLSQSTHFSSEDVNIAWICQKIAGEEIRVLFSLSRQWIANEVTKHYECA